MDYGEIADPLGETGDLLAEQVNYLASLEEESDEDFA